MPDYVAVPRRWVDEVVIALDSATTIAERERYALDLGNQDRLVAEAAENGWSRYAHVARRYAPNSGRRPGDGD